MTAVEWLKGKLIENGTIKERVYVNSGNENLFAQAKQMEREQIEEAYKEGWKDDMREEILYTSPFNYFTQNYGK